MAAIKRISEHEVLMNEAEKALHQLDEALAGIPKLQQDLQKLETYYTSPAWKRDFEASEKGQIPKDMPCGVLSEDGIYNLLEENQELIALMKELSEQFGKDES